jgi:hypothetical protein
MTIKNNMMKEKKEENSTVLYFYNEKLTCAVKRMMRCYNADDKKRVICKNENLKEKKRK